MPKLPEDPHFYNGCDAPKDHTLFNGQLLDQRREDCYLVLLEMALIR